MALKATIFKADLKVSDMDRNYYQNHALIIARHPSETNERMMVRVLAFAMYADEALAFGGGISTDDEPALWKKDHTGAVELWVETGLPDEKNIRKASGRAERVVIISYGGRGADLWWNQNSEKLKRLANLTVINLPTDATQALAAMADRTMKLQCTIQDGQIWIGGASETVHLEPVSLIAPEFGH